MNLKIMEAKNVDCWIDLDIFHTAKYLDEIFSSQYLHYTQKEKFES